MLNADLLLGFIWQLAVLLTFG